MRTRMFLHVFAVLTVSVLSLFSLTVPAAAKEKMATVGTTLTFEAPSPVFVGTKAMIIMHLISSKGEPVVNQRIELFVNGERLRSAKTDAGGTVAIGVTRDTAGVYELSATFKGSKSPSLGSSKATAELVVTPAPVEIRVTPPLPEIRFKLGRQIFASDEYGVARIEVAKAGSYNLEVLPIERQDEQLQMEFGRWGDDYFEPGRTIEVPLKKPLEVGFEVSYQVSQVFVDLQDRPVDESRVTSITLKGSNGTTFQFEDNGPHWLPAGRVIRLNNGLQETKILYSIINVEIDGSNVVSQAQQRFYVNPEDIWTVKLLLYKARFTAKDALFGFQIGSGIHVEYPDGETVSYPFSESGDIFIDGLARGIYRVTVTGAEGYAPPTPIALSRDQDVELLVFSYVDIGVLAAIGLFLSVGLLLFGRPYLLTQVVASGRRLLPRRRSEQPATLTQTDQP